MEITNNQLDTNAETFPPNNLNKPQRKRRYLFSFVAVTTILLVFTIYLLIGSIQKQINKEGVKTSSHGLTPTAKSIPDNSLQGVVTWNDFPSEISPNSQLALLATIASASGARYYFVGTWTSEPYKGSQLIDAFLQVPNDPNTLDETVGTEILRVSIVENKIIYFSSSSTIYLTSVPHNLRSDTFVIDFHQIPDLITSYPTSTYSPQRGSRYINFPVVYQGKTKQFQFYSLGIGPKNIFTTNPPGYHFLTTFFHGQKVYARDQFASSIPLSNAEDNPYIVIDVDGSQDNIIDLGEILDTQQWVTYPKYMDKLNALGPNQNIYYDANYKNGCTFYKAADLSHNDLFSPSDLNLVMTSGQDAYYFDSNLSQLYQTLYGYFTSSSYIKPIPPPYTFDFFVQTDPVIFKKDVFGAYEIYYREDYANNAAGC